MKKIINILFVILFIFTVCSGSNKKNISISRNKYMGQRVQSAAEYLIEHSNLDSIVSYNEGIKGQMYTFNHSDNDTINDFIDYRFIGDFVNNYVYFNCSDTEDYESCELWRIIGVFVVENQEGIKQYHLKLVSSKSIGKYVFDENNSNSWLNSSLFEFLNNGDFWFSFKGKFQDMIDNVKFKSGSFNLNNLSGNDLYLREQKLDSYIGKVGLLLPSDYSYTFSLGISDNCFNDLKKCTEYDKSWLNLDNPTFTILGDGNSNGVYVLDNNIRNVNVSDEYDIYPVIYLKSNVGIESGNGSVGDAYVLRLLKKSEIQSEADMDTSNSIKKEVYVDDTSSLKSKIFIIISFLIILGGLFIFIINFIKSKKEIK